VSTYETLRPFDVVPIGVVVARRHSPEQTFFIGSRGSLSPASFGQKCTCKNTSCPRANLPS